MQIHGIDIVDTFAEAFPMSACRVIVTAVSESWVQTAAHAATGYAASVIGCDAEAGIERVLPDHETPDHRPGVALLFFAFNRDALQKAVVNRVGQCVLTCATTAVYSGLDGEPGKSIRVGGNLRYFGDGWQISKLLKGKRYWRLPVMDGEFLCEDQVGTVKGCAGGNIILLGRTQGETLAAAEAAVTAIQKASLPVILPFPGGIVRSGSKVGSKYAKLKASTNDAYCPTLRGVVSSELPEGCNAAYEIVIDGLTVESVRRAMAVGIRAACRSGIVRITAGNYGGKLGPYHLKLRELLAESGSC